MARIYPATIKKREKERAGEREWELGITIELDGVIHGCDRPGQGTSGGGRQEKSGGEDKDSAGLDGRDRPM